MMEADLDGDGKINPREWKEYVERNPSLLKNMTLPHLKCVLKLFTVSAKISFECSLLDH